MTQSFAGARWWKFDFHTHTPFSRDTPWHGQTGDQELSPEAWLLRWMAAEIDCVAVTDHNGAGWINQLKSALALMPILGVERYRPLHLFPGVELSVSGGVHILAIFGPEADQQKVDDLISKCGFSGTRGDSEPRTARSLPDVLKTIAECGGVAVAAHADQDNGLLRHQDGPTIEDALRSGNLLALEIVDQAWLKPQVLRDAPPLAEVVGSDCHNFRGGSERLPGRRFTWVKMGEPSLEGLRLALLDASPMSIRRGDPNTLDPNRTPATYVDRITIRDAMYAGRGREMVVPLSPWLSTLIGGRGTGKSTALQMLRVAMGLAADLPSGLSEEFERFKAVNRGKGATGAFTVETKIEIEFVRAGVRQRVRWQAATGSVLEEQASGDWRELTRDASAVAASLPLQLLSQKQVFAIASEPSGLLQLIDKAPAVDLVGWEQRRREIEATYLRVRGELRETVARLADRPRRQQELADVARQIKLFEDGDQKVLLRTYQRTRQQRAMVDRLTQDMGDAASKLSEILSNLHLSDLREDLFDTQDDVESGLLMRLRSVRANYDKRIEDVRAAVASLDALAREWVDGLAGSEWTTRESDAASKYAELVERMRREGVAEPGAYRSLVARRQGLEQQLQALVPLEARSRALEEQSARLLQELAMHRRTLTGLRESFLATELAGNEHVRIRVVAFGDGPDSAEDGLRAVLSAPGEKLKRDILEDGAGILGELYHELPEGSAERVDAMVLRVAELKERVNAVVAGNEDVRWTRWMFNHIRSLPPEQLDRLQCWWPADSVEVSYQQAPGKFAPIQKGSPGQKSAAILAFLLAHGSEPIILDQPEDDLDNELIYDLIVQRIRSSKEARQVVIATHNANIVVNGDAELVLVMANAGGQCWVKESGCLQDRAIREAICRVMEGGEKAFVDRYRRIVQEMRAHV